MKNKILPLITISLVSFVSAHTGEEEFGHHMMDGWIMGSWGMGLFGWIFGALVITALVLLIIWLSKQIKKK